MAVGYGLDHIIHLQGLAAGGPYESMVLDFIEARAEQLAAALPKPVSVEDWQARAETLRAYLHHSLGLTHPPPRTPLAATGMGRIARDGYVIEKLIYEPRPGFPTPAHLYVPQATGSPMPAVLYSMGHYMENGKLDPEVQQCCANLAKLGFVVLVYDAIGQGERRGDWLDHGHLEPLLVGLSQEALMVWESLRAIDYLVSRPEVDAHRIGMTGSSGGGLNTFYTSAVDQRIQVSLPVCFVTTFHRMMASERDRNWEDGRDLCNQVPRVMAYAEMWDILGLFAPKPLRIITALRDPHFPVDGTRKVYTRLRLLYSLMDAEHQVDLVEVDAPHAYNQEMRQAAYGWFARWLQGIGNGNPIPEQDCELLPLSHPGAYTQPRRQGLPAEASPALCLAPEQAITPGPAITALANKLAEALEPERIPPDSGAAWAQQRRDVLARVPDIIGFRPSCLPGPLSEEQNMGRQMQPAKSPDLWADPKPRAIAAPARIFNRTQAGNLIAERAVFESEPGIQVPGLFLMPNQWEMPSPVVVYVDEWGKRAGLMNGLFDDLLAAGYAVLALDVRGWGETGVSDFEATTNALMTDFPLFGQRLWDLLEAIRRLRSGGYVSGHIDRTRIGCIGQGSAALLALYAAALDDRIAATVMWQSPLSYRSLILERPDFPPSVFLFDVLGSYDLPDLMATVAPRPLLISEPVNGRRCPLSQADATALCSWPRIVYETLNTELEKLQVHIDDADAENDKDDKGKRAPGQIVGWLQSHL